MKYPSDKEYNCILYVPSFLRGLVIPHLYKLNHRFHREKFLQTLFTLPYSCQWVPLSLLF